MEIEEAGNTAENNDAERIGKKMVLAYIWAKIEKLSPKGQDAMVTLESLNAQLDDSYPEGVVLSCLFELERRGFIGMGRGPFGPEGASVEFLKINEEMRCEDLESNAAMFNLWRAV